METFLEQGRGGGGGELMHVRNRETEKYSFSLIKVLVSPPPQAAGGVMDVLWVGE